MNLKLKILVFLSLLLVFILNTFLFSQEVTHYTTNNGLISNKVTGLAVDKNNHLWCIYFNGGLSTYNGSEWKSINSPNISGEYYRSIFIDSKENIWIGGTGNIYKYIDTSWTSYTEFPIKQNWLIFDICEDKTGNIWFAGNGVMKYDGIKFTAFDESDGLVDNDVLSISIDSNNTKWFGTTNGISKFDDHSWVNYEYTKDSSIWLSSVYGLTFDKNNKTYASCMYGIAVFEGDGFAAEIVLNVYPGEFFSTNKTQGNVFCTVNGTLFTLTDSGWDQFQYHSKGDARCVIQDLNGNVWIGSVGSLFDDSGAGEGVFKVSYSSNIIKPNQIEADNIINYNIALNTIIINDYYKDKSIELFDLNGRKLLEKHNSNFMSLPDLPVGIYLVHVKTSDNKLFIRKIVV